MSTIKVNAKDDRYSLENYPVIKSEIRVILKRLSPSSSSSSSLSPVSPSSLSSSFTLVADTSYRNDFNFLSQLISVFIRSIELNDTNSNDNLCRIGITIIIIISVIINIIIIAVLLGKSSIRMRDEILIQILYRIRLYHCYNQVTQIIIIIIIIIIITLMIIKRILITIAYIVHLAHVLRTSLLLKYLSHIYQHFYSMRCHPKSVSISSG